tara:strand:+ start:30 stop:1172 length:1143 start_codon:yes stop_codon:yes gene_type:complete
MTTPNDTTQFNQKPQKQAVSTKETNPVTQKQTEIPTKDKEQKRSTSPIGFVAALSSLAALALGIYSVNKIVSIETRMQTARVHHNQSRQQILSHLEAKLQTQENQFHHKITEVETEQTKRMALMNVSLTELNKNTRGDDQSWKLQKTAYLLGMAQLTLHWEKTPTSSIELLTAADRLLKGLNNPQLIGLRQSISNELLSLKSIPKLDTVGLLGQLAAMSQQVDKLPIKKPIDKQAVELTVKESPIPNETASAWKKALNITLNNLSKIIVIRKHSEPYQPIISNEEQQLITRQMQLNFKQAQWALLNQKADIYQFSLKQIQQGLNTYFDDKASQTQSMLSSVSTLMQEKITPHLPVIDRSYQQLMAIINTLNTPNKKGVNA